ncbi:MAG: flagellar protein FliT [Gammaproteobacteria bacterium]
MNTPGTGYASQAAHDDVTPHHANGHHANVIAFPGANQGEPQGRGPLILRILSLSERMLSEAMNSAWDKVSQFDAERQRLAWELGGAPQSPGERGRWDEQIQRISHISRELTRLAAKDRDEVASQLKRLHQRDQMTQAYAAF